MTTSESTSQPESLDLDYDMWQGQFEFVGINNNNNNNSNNNNSTTSNAIITTTNNNNNNNINNKLYLNNNNNNISNSDKLSSHKLKNDSLEDLNFNIQTPPDFSKPILIDEETFLSLQPNDFDDIVTSGPNSTIFLDSNNTIYETTTTPSPSITTNNHNTTGKILNNIENINLNNNLHHTHKYNCNKTNNNKIEILKNYKNKLICDSIQTNGIVNNNNNNTNPNKMMNGFTAEICDNFNEQLEILQRQVTDLADSQNTVDDRTTRTKTEYAVLQARYHMLEEQYREAELRAEERLAEEQKRHRELLARVEREAALQNENCQIKIRTIEIEANALRDETQRLRLLCDKQSKDLHETEEKLEIAKHTITLLQSEINEIRINEKKCQDDKQAAEDLMIELGKELERLRSEHGPALPTTSPETLRLEELHMELDELRQKNKSLEEQNEELQAAVLTRGVEEGRHLLNGTLNSLAQELEEMSQAQDSVDSATLASLSQLQQAYQDKEEENQRLKHYIDTILLNIVENYPQLLEVKATPTSMTIPSTTATSATMITDNISK